jgi:hypothetical protein
LADVKAARRNRHAVSVGDCNEVAELSQIHKRIDAR